jgi:hypothetical protein
MFIATRTMAFTVALALISWVPNCLAGSVDLRATAASATDSNPKVAKRAILALRSSGPVGLTALFDAYRNEIESHTAAQNAQVAPTQKSAPEGNRQTASWDQIKSAIDAVSGQYDGYTSQLYWYTDFATAKSAAKATGKPILSLRMLGNLTEECSCANSRFFRSTLYANAEVSKYLRDNFVLHWQSVRPVPKVTIDFGNGRKLERTVTGNSIHYVLDQDGRVVDALPGLYGPKAFVRGLADATNILADIPTSLTPADIRKSFHKSRAESILVMWNEDLRKLGISPPGAKPQTAQATAQRPNAVVANDIAAPKAAGEARIIAAALADARALSSATDDAVWARIAQLHQADAELDASSRSLIRAQNPPAAKAGELAMTKGKVEDPIVRMVRNLQNAMAIDTVRNEYTLHRQIHEWFASGEVPLNIDVNVLNDRVYAQLFLTPRTDPWLGLLPDDTYTALDNNGLVQQ